MESDMGLIIDLMPEDNLAFDIIVEREKTNEYYQRNSCVDTIPRH